MSDTTAGKKSNAATTKKNMQSAHHYATAEEDRVPLLKRIAFGFGNFSDHIGTQTLNVNANPIFNVALHVDPRLLGVAMALMRLWDAITDPILGVISDNTRTRWGRRRPYMFVGAILSGLTFPILWFVPAGMDEMNIFLWFTVCAILFLTFQTCYTIPYTGLGFELTPDYHERTRVMEMRAYLGTAVNLAVPWAYAFTQMHIWNGNTLLGARWMGVTVGVVIIITGLIPVFSLRERFFNAAKDQVKTGIYKGIKMTLKNKPFLMMIMITLLTMVGARTIDFLGFYIGLYYLFDGDTAKQAILTGVSGNVAVVIAVCSVFILNKVSRRIGKRHALGLCLILLILSSFAKWIFYQPNYPYLSILVHLFTAPSIAGFWLLIASIKADVCDDDELTTGLRREGSIGAISAWISKLSYSVTTVLAGFVLVYTGYDAANGAAQPVEVVNRMRWCYYFVPALTAIPALLLLIKFPISEERAHQTRLELEARRGKI